MNYTFFFFICASIAFGLSVISICTAPIINGIEGSSWGNNNCKYLSDELDYYKKEHSSPNDDEKKEITRQQREINVCKREKAMHGLEYSSLICDVFFGGVCAILGLLHYLEVGKSIEKKTGLSGIIAGTIGFVLTLVYVVFSAYIFNNDYPYTYVGATKNYIKKLFPNRANKKWNGYQFVFSYDIDEFNDDNRVENIKYNELGQKQYNYDSELFKNYKESPSTINNCFAENAGCSYVWLSYNPNDAAIYDIHNKYIYDSWITTLIFSVLISVVNIGIILFGFFLFTQSESSPGSVPLPMSSVNAA